MSKAISDVCGAERKPIRTKMLSIYCGPRGAVIDAISCGPRAAAFRPELSEIEAACVIISEE
ncbi:MAG: hypothetical protein EXS15_08190 [Phycisphaerales bacterium]|nr:hypothetical protein [Phycisphaerales bacterium]